jgi:hypothetical protein
MTKGKMTNLFDKEEPPNWSKKIPFMDIIYEHTFYNKLTIKFDQFGCSTLYINWIWTNDVQ